MITKTELNLDHLPPVPNRRHTSLVEELVPLVEAMFLKPEDQTSAWKLVTATIRLLGKRESDVFARGSKR